MHPVPGLAPLAPLATTATTMTSVMLAAIGALVAVAGGVVTTGRALWLLAQYEAETVGESDSVDGSGMRESDSVDGSGRSHSERVGRRAGPPLVAYGLLTVGFAALVLTGNDTGVVWAAWALVTVVAAIGVAAVAQSD